MAKPLLSYDDIVKLKEKLPRDLQLDILQFGLDLMGILNPAADAASAAISFWRGDFLGGAISMVSIIPVGDVLKIAKLGRYAKTLETLVTKVIPNNPTLYKELTPLMEQLRSLLAKVPSGNSTIEMLRLQVNNFFKNAALHRKIPGLKVIDDFAKFASKRGSWKKNAYMKFGTTPQDVVDRLLNATTSKQHVSLTQNAKEMIRMMAQRDWVISAGPHRTTRTAGKFKDQTPHITIEFSEKSQDIYHLRLDHKGHIFEIRNFDGQRIDNVVPGTSRPWVGPGS